MSDKEDFDDLKATPKITVEVIIVAIITIEAILVITIVILCWCLNRKKTVSSGTVSAVTSTTKDQKTGSYCAPPQTTNNIPPPPPPQTPKNIPPPPPPPPPPSSVPVQLKKVSAGGSKPTGQGAPPSLFFLPPVPSNRFPRNKVKTQTNFRPSTPPIRFETPTLRPPPPQLY